jgi:predicted TIM-barrel fold metal-dependent hydrolase
MAGVFERYPNLKFVMTETMAEWVPDYLAVCDRLYEAAKVPGSSEEFFGGPAVTRLPKRPSEYFATNCWIGASFMTAAESARRYEIGLDRLMWGSDLPHSEGTYPHTLEALRVVFASIPLEETKLILSETPAAVYGFDLGKLQKLADEIGPLVSDIQTPLAAEDWPKVPGESLCSTFAGAPLPGVQPSTSQR